MKMFSLFVIFMYVSNVLITATFPVLIAIVIVIVVTVTTVATVIVVAALWVLLPFDVFVCFCLRY